MAILKRDFYEQEATTVARALLGAILVRQIDGQRVSGRIVETEAYRVDDQAAHWRRGRTPRNQPAWDAPGHAYIYFTYGMHWLINAVCEPADHPAAVLIRALEPREGHSFMAAQRPGIAPRDWTRGPGRLTRALHISGALNRADLTSTASGVWIEAGDTIADEAVQRGPRIGLGSTPEPWFSIPWRWWIAGNPYVSH
jgi:DNA-3-methyladenine glycosylase